MPAWIVRALRTGLTRVSWARVVAIVAWLVKQGRDRFERNLTAHEREDLIRLARKSKGRPGNLNDRERTRVRRLVQKALTGNA